MKKVILIVDDDKLEAVISCQQKDETYFKVLEIIDMPDDPWANVPNAEIKKKMLAKINKDTGSNFKTWDEMQSVDHDGFTMENGKVSRMDDEEK